MRFAILCRVSTQNQATDGVSLDVQRETLTNCVRQLRGDLVKSYVGHEHATSGYDRPILDDAIEDAKGGLFDALMVYDLSRLTRDTVSSGVIRADLKKYRVKLFVQLQEYDLDNEDTTFFIDLMAAINSRTVRIQNKKSLESKIALAKQGWQVFGRAPWGRKLAHNDHSKPAEWLVEPDKLSLAQKIYDMYINQKIYVNKIGALLKLEPSTLFRILKDRGNLKQTFEINGEREEIYTPVPPLFTIEQQAKIKKRLKDNKKNNAARYDYLLRSYVKCEICKTTFIGFHNNAFGHTYYRHSVHSNRTERCANHIPLMSLNIIVLNHISEIVGNNDKLLDIIKSCNNNSESRKETLTNQLILLKTSQATLQRKKERILNLMLELDNVSDDLKVRLNKVVSELTAINTDITSKQVELDSLNHLDVPDEIIKKINYIIRCFKDQFGAAVIDWPFLSQRALVEWFFGTSSSNGVFVSRLDNEFTYTIKSTLGTLAFGFINDGDGPAGITFGGRSSASLTDFKTILEQLQIDQQVGEYTRMYIGEHQRGFVYIKIEVVGSLLAPKAGPKKRIN